MFDQRPFSRLKGFLFIFLQSLIPNTITKHTHRLYQKQNITRIMGQDFQLKSLDGINWQPFPDVKPTGKKSNKVYKQKKKTTPATQTL